MAYTTYSQAWLEDNTSIRALFAVVEVWDVVQASAQTVYLSTVGYATEDSSVVFQPLITKGIQFTESLSLDGDSAGLTYGDIEIHNPNGDIDTWLDSSKYIWKNRQVQIYLGDPFWTSTNIADLISKCSKIFDGVVYDIGSRSRETLNIQLRDKLEFINTPITEEVFTTATGTWSNTSPIVDVIKSLVFGEVFNITPILIDPATQQYMIADGPVERLIEVRDNGVPIYNSTITGGANVTGIATTGTFTLSAAAYGTITASAQGLKKSVTISSMVSNATYVNNIANLVATIVTQYGKDTKLVPNDIDISNFTSFSSNTQSVGCIITDKVNTIDLCRSIVGSIGAQIRMTREGKLQILRLSSNPISPTFTIEDTDILHHSLNISSRPEVVASVTLGCCKNYTVQENLETGITTQAKNNMSMEWYETKDIDTTTQNLYKLTGEAEQQDTLLVVRAEADAEATRRLSMFNVQRTVYKFTGTAKLLTLYLGQVVTLKHSRFGLENGKVGQVVSLSPDWLNSKVEVEVFI